MNVRVKIKRLSPDAVIPQYANAMDAGFDLVASEDVIIEPGETAIVPTGIAISLPHGYEAQIRPRSGITVKTKLRVQLGTIDSGYVGEIGVIVDNIAPDTSDDDSGDGFVGTAETIEGEYIEVGIAPEGTYIIRRGDRVAQAVIAPVERAHFVEVAELEDTQRGGNGFGSSGVKASFDKAVAKNDGALT